MFTFPIVLLNPIMLVVFDFLLFFFFCLLFFVYFYRQYCRLDFVNYCCSYDDDGNNDVRMLFFCCFFPLFFFFCIIKPSLVIMHELNIYCLIVSFSVFKLFFFWFFFCFIWFSNQCCNKTLVDGCYDFEMILKLSFFRFN